MRINKITLKNIGPHKNFCVSLGGGLIGIVGANGAGKSTLINSIYAALTNDFTRFSNVKSDIITNGTGTEESFIRLEGSHRGRGFDLTRWLRPNKTEFQFGPVTYTKANDVNAAIVSELNITKTVIDKYVFVDQWQMFGFLNETAAERAKTFQFLCGTEDANKIHKICSDYVTNQQGIEIVDNSVELEEVIVEAESRMSWSESFIKAADSLILSKHETEEMQEIIRCYSAASLARTQQKTFKISIKSQLKACKKLKEEELEIERQLGLRETWLKSNRVKIGQAQARLDSSIDYESAMTTHKDALLGFTAADDKLKSFVVPVVPVNYCPDSLREGVSHIVYDAFCRIQLVDSIKKSMAVSGKLPRLNGGAKPTDVVCHACHQIITAEHRQQLFDQLDADSLTVELNNDRLQESKKYDESLKRYDGLNLLKQKYQDQLKTSESVLTAYGSMDLDFFVSLVRKTERIELQVAQLKAKVEKHRNKRHSSEHDYRQTKARLAHCLQTIALAPDDERFVLAGVRLEQSNQATLNRAESLGAYKEAKESKNRAASILSQLKTRLANKVKIRNLLKTVSEVRDLFHWNQLPKAVSQANLELLVAGINTNLQLFNNSFVVEADCDLTFKVFFPGQQPVKARQLSGGQKVILAIAFRAALDQVFGNDVGMMFLDEPTSGLDADNMHCFHEALQKLAAKTGEDRQLVVITHVHELSSAFDQLVEVQKI